MNECSNCSQSSPGSTKFCIHCGTAFAQPVANSFAGRPVVSMDRQIPIQQPDSAAPNVQQLQISSANQVQSTSISQVLPKKSFQGNKIILGVVAAIVAIGVLVLIGGQGDSGTPTVAPDSQQSGYSSDDDWQDGFRSAFMEGCVDGDNYANCVCMLETSEEFYTAEEVANFAELGDISFLDPVIEICT